LEVATFAPAALARISHASRRRGAGIPGPAKARATEGAGLGGNTLPKPEASATRAGPGRTSRSPRWR